jgi:hypothetical protein
MEALSISLGVRAKLNRKVPPVSEDEIAECFANRCGVNLLDEREDNQTDPPTLWFVAETNSGRLLKIVYVFKNGTHYLKTAYDPNEIEIAIYEKYGK